MVETTTKVSVIMPSLNVAPYIEECMESVVNQTLKEIEIICVDAGSTDGTLEILHSYAEKDPRIKLINSGRKSYGYQMNLGIQAAAGEYIGIVETDDYIKLDMYEVLYKVATENGLDFVKSDFYKFFVSNGKHILDRNSLWSNKKAYLKLYNPSLTPSLLKLTMNNVTGIYSRQLLTHNDIRLNETAGASYQDNGLWFQIFSHAKKAMFVDRAFYCIRRDNPNSSVHDKGKIYCICDEYKFIHEKLKENPEIYERFYPYFLVKKFDNYLFTYNRIANDYKEEFLARFQNDFKMPWIKGEITSISFEPWKINVLKEIIDNPQLFFYLNPYGYVYIGEEHKANTSTKLEYIKNRQSAAEIELLLIRKSASYKIGRFITFIPRKIRTFCRYVKKYGLMQTLKIIIDRFK